MKITTDVIDYAARFETINVDKDVAVLRSENYIGLFTVGEDNNLYVYSECSGNKSQFEKKSIFDSCKEFAGMRMGDTNNFILSVISNDEVYICITDNPTCISKTDFKKIQFSDPEFIDLHPYELFINSGSKESTIAVMMKDSRGRVSQYIVNVSIDKIDIESEPLACNFTTIKSVACGRAVKQRVDGVYIFGLYGDSEQLLYTPVSNPYGSLPPSPLRLGVPEKGIDAVGLCHFDSAQNENTHLFAAGNGTLYFYPHDKQYDCNRIDYSNYEKVIDSSCYADVLKIVSYIDKNNTCLYVWALNRSGVLSYIYATVSEDGSMQWIDTPIVFKEHIKYFDISENNIVLCNSKELLFGTRSKECGLSFSSVNIDTKLDVLSKQRSFATRIMVDSSSEKIRLKSETPISAYVNNKYYRFTDITVDPDLYGGVDVVQVADGLIPEPFEVQRVKYDNTKDTGEEENISEVYDEGTVTETLNYFPGQKAYEMLLELNEPDKLKSAKIYDIHGNYKFLASDLNDEQINQAADAINQIKMASESISNGTVLLQQRSGVIDKMFNYVEEAFDYVRTTLNNIVDKVVEFVTEIVSDVIHFVIKVAGKIICIVLNTAMKCFKCIVELLELLGIPVDKIIDWLLSFLDIDGAIRLNSVVRNSLTDGKDMFVKQLENTNEKCIAVFNNVIEKISDWAFDDTELIETDTDKYYDNSMFSSPAAMNLYNSVFKSGEVNNISIDDKEIDDETKNLLDDIISQVNNIEIEKENDLKVFLDDIAKSLKEIKSFNDVVNVLKKILGLISIVGVKIINDIISQLFNFVISMVDWAYDCIMTKINNSFFSELLEIFGLENACLFDLMFFPVSVLYNLSYYIINGKSVVPENMFADDKIFSEFSNMITLKEVSDEGSEPDLKEEYESYYKRMVKGGSYTELDKSITLRAVVSVVDLSADVLSFTNSTIDLVADKPNMKFLSLSEATCTLTSYILLNLKIYLFYTPLKYVSTMWSSANTYLWMTNVILSLSSSLFNCVSYKVKKLDGYSWILSLIQTITHAAVFATQIVACVEETKLLDNISYEDSTGRLIKKDETLYKIDISALIIKDGCQSITSVLNIIALFCKGSVTAKVVVESLYAVSGLIIPVIGVDIGMQIALMVEEAKFEDEIIEEYGL